MNKVPLAGAPLVPKLTKQTVSASVFLLFAIQSCTLWTPLKKVKLMFVLTHSRGVFINFFNAGETTKSKARQGNTLQLVGPHLIVLIVPRPPDQ